MKSGRVNSADCTKQAIMSKYISEINFLHRRLLAAENLLEQINSKVFGYILCDIEVPENLRAKFSKFLTIFKTTLVSKNDIVDLSKLCAEKREKCLNLGKCWCQASHYKTVHWSLLCFFLATTGTQLYKKHLFVEYTPKKSFNSFVRSPMDAGRLGDENRTSSVVAETRKLMTQKLLRQPEFWPQPTRCNQVPQWRKDAGCYWS